MIQTVCSMNSAMRPILGLLAKAEELTHENTETTGLSPGGPMA